MYLPHILNYCNYCYTLANILFWQVKWIRTQPREEVCLFSSALDGRVTQWHLHNNSLVHINILDFKNYELLAKPLPPPEKITLEGKVILHARLSAYSLICLFITSSKSYIRHLFPIHDNNYHFTYRTGDLHSILSEHRTCDSSGRGHGCFIPVFHSLLCSHSGSLFCSYLTS